MAEVGKYGIVYADPPWRYDRKRGNGVAENHYPTMSIEEICALPVADLAAKDSALFLWATFPQLNEAFRVMEAWGFQYKTLAFLWLKQNRKADSWTRYGIKSSNSWATSPGWNFLRDNRPPAGMCGEMM